MAPPDGNGNGNGAQSWWSPKTLILAIKEVGLLGAIAIYLVYTGATEIPKIVRNIERILIQQEAIQQLQHEQITQTNELLRVARYNCRMIAGKDENARHFCD